MFVLDLLDNLPRMRLSRRHLQFIMWVMKEAGASNVPSWYAFQEIQKELQAKCGVPTNHFVSSVDNILYINDIPQIVAKVSVSGRVHICCSEAKQDYCNPQTAPLLQFYPEHPSGPVSEVWQASRWRKLPWDLLTPMYRSGVKDYFVNEVSELKTGEYVIPTMWIIRRKQLCADAHKVTVTAVSCTTEVVPSDCALTKEHRKA